jgi:hypothetical protein
MYQVTTLQAQLLQLQNEIKIEGKKQLPTSQVAARELIADITSTLSVRSSRVAQSTSALSQQNGHRTLATFNLNAVQTDDELGDVSETCTKCTNLAACTKCTNLAAHANRL